MHFKVLDIADWPVLSQEPGGAEPKDWVCPPGEDNPAGGDSRANWWLFKRTKIGKLKAAGGADAGTYRRHDDAAERIASALARLIGLPAAEVELARTDSESGIISRNVVPDEWSIQGGDVVLSELPGYLSCQGSARPVERTGHNLENIRAVLDQCGGPPGPHQSDPAFAVFAGYLIFDAWIANTDRHAMNWAVLYGDDQTRLAASFDHGSALASGSTDESLAATG